MEKITIDDAITLLKFYHDTPVTFRQYNKKAFWFTDFVELPKYGRVSFLKSYGSIVGFDCWDLNLVIEVRRYTQTASRQMTDYFNELAMGEKRIELSRCFEYDKINY